MTGALALTLLPGIASAQPDDLGQQIADTARELSAVIEEYNAAREDLDATEQRSRVLAQQVTALSEALAESRAQVARLATTSLRTRGPATVAAMLDTASAAELTDRLLLLNRIARDEQRQLAALRINREQYEQTQLALAAAEDQQRALTATLADKRQRIEADLAELHAARHRASVQGTPATPDAVPADQRPSLPAGPMRDVISFAYDQLGKPYRWAAAGPHGYDCSGLTRAVWSAAGVQLPHNSGRQWDQATSISRADLQAGDLVFYYPDISHVALYVGAGLVLHAPTFGKQVRLDPVDHAPVHSFGRITPP